MPIVIRKLPNKDKYRVYNKTTGTVYAKQTTKEKAERQKRLLELLEKKRK